MFTESDNVLAEFGQMPTPPAGSQIRKIEIKDEDHQGFFDRMKDRYIWFPLHDVNFAGKMAHQPMAFIHLYRGRIHWVQSVSYKQVDNSPEALDQIGEEELPLRSFICTPFAQCVYLFLNYGQKGMRVLEHLKGESPEVVSFIEQIILPNVPTDLMELGKYLSEESSKNIKEADLDPKTDELAKQTLATMIGGTTEAIKYCRELIAESEAEILTRQNKGWGKSHLDQNDRYAYKMVRKIVPAESTLDNSPEKRTNELLEKMVGALSNNALANSAANAREALGKEDPSRVAALEAELAELNRKFDLLLGAKVTPVPDGAPVLADTKVVNKDEATKVLEQKLNSTKNRPTR